MTNQVIIVGRLVATPKLEENDGKKICNITVAVPRSFKNANGEYETDFIDCILWHQIAENATECCKKGEVIGVKGRLQSKNIENKDGTKMKKLELIAERLITLQNAKKESEEI